MNAAPPSAISNRRHAIITGGSSGIGYALAAGLAAEGYGLTLIARQHTRLQAAKAALVKLGSAGVGTLCCDAADGPALEASIDLAQKTGGPCDLLITAAGIVVPGRFDALDAGAFRTQMAVNYFGTVAAVRAVYGGMCARRSGHIVMIASAAALVGVYGYTAYGGSKFAVRGFAEALRGEARQNGVFVSIAYPGDTNTPQFTAEARDRPPETTAIAGGASLAEPDDVARAILAGVARNDFAIYPSRKVAALGRFSSLVAPILNARFDQIVRRFER